MTKFLMVALVLLTFQFSFCLLESSQLELGILSDQIKLWDGDGVVDLCIDIWTSQIAEMY